MRTLIIKQDCRFIFFFWLLLIPNLQRVPWKDNIRDDSGLVLAVLEMRVGEEEKYLFELEDRDSHQFLSF